MTIRLRPMRCSLALVAVLSGRLAAQGFVIQLQRQWVTKYADRATIDASMNVHHAHKSANSVSSGGNDGDMHFSGESSDIGLPFVAEIVNAASPGQKAAIGSMKAKEGGQTPLAISGAWRLWFEHPSAKQTQGANNPFSPDNTNPDHSFEIHPVSRVDQNDVRGSFVPIKSYAPYTGDVAFDYFDKCQVVIRATNSSITIASKKLKYNYVGFDIVLSQAPKRVADGYIALAKVYKTGNHEDEVTESDRRMIFIDGTPAAARISRASSGDSFTVLGIPRLNLNAVLTLVKKHGTAQFNAQLPYEMIIVGVK